MRVVKSEKAGLGKTLYKTRLSEKIFEQFQTSNQEDFPLSITIPLSQKEMDMLAVSNRLLQFTLPKDVSLPRIFHIDVAYGVGFFVMISRKCSYSIGYLFTSTMTAFLF